MYSTRTAIGQSSAGLVTRIPIQTEMQLFILEDAKRALLELKRGRVKGAKVLVIHERVGKPELTGTCLSEPSCLSTKAA